MAEISVELWRTTAGWFFHVLDGSERVLVTTRGPLTFEQAWLDAREATEFLAAGPTSEEEGE